MSDYRLELQAQIQSKALGWAFRASDPKNFLAAKIEVVRPGLEPGLEWVRFTVMNGQESPRVRLPLTLRARLDTVYKIRLEALGDRFTAWVQDQKVDQWTDPWIPSGGVGLYYDRGESASLQGGIAIVPLSIKP